MENTSHDKAVVLSDRGLALTYLKKLNALVVWFFGVSLVFGFFVNNQAIFSANFESDLLRFFSVDMTNISSKYFLTYLTSFFVHADLSHLLANYLVLIPAGVVVQGKLGLVRTFGVAALGHGVGILAQLSMYHWLISASALTSPRQASYLLGASSVAFCFVALALLMHRKYILYGTILIGYVAYSLIYVDPSSGFYAHLASYVLATILQRYIKLKSGKLH